MKLAWSRKALAALFILIMTVLISSLYGKLYILNPVLEQTQTVTELMDKQQALLADYPPDEAVLAEAKAEYALTESFLPEGEKMNNDIVNLTRIAEKHHVMIQDFSRAKEPQAIEGMDERYRASVYNVNMVSADPENMVQVLAELSKQERVWDIHSFQFERTSEDRYAGSFAVTFYSHIMED